MVDETEFMVMEADEDSRMEDCLREAFPMKTYVTFGQSHIHRFGPIVFDKDCVAEIDCYSHAQGRQLAVEMFGDKFFTTYTDLDKVKLKYYPRGLINVSAP